MQIKKFARATLRHLHECHWTRNILPTLSVTYWLVTNTFPPMDDVTPSVYTGQRVAGYVHTVSRKGQKYITGDAKLRPT